MINPRISADWNTTKQIAPVSCTPRVQRVHTKAEVLHPTPCLQGLGVLLNCHALESIAKHMINPRISADWSTTKPNAAFSCTQRVQEVRTKAGVVHLTTGLQGFGVIFNCHAQEMYCETYDYTLEYLQIGLRLSRLQQSLVHKVYKKYVPKMRSYTLSPVSQAQR